MDTSLPETASLSTTKRALLALQEMQAKLDALEQAKTEPIAIIGMGCRFPGGADNTDTLWKLLIDGVDTITEIPTDRWDMEAYYDPDPDVPGKMSTRYGGFLESVDTFDAQFFGISPREAVSIDPQQRLLLEVSWEALEHANQAHEQLFNSSTGVFVGIYLNDYSRVILPKGDVRHIDGYFGSGNALSAAAGRLSYSLGLTGPSLAIDTACSSSLVAVHLACQSLRLRECDLSLAGGVHLQLVPDVGIAFSKARMLAPDGRCKTFDAAANGTARGEGCGVIVLKRLSDALADGNPILALIRGSSVNQDGPSGGLTVPNGPAQEAVIRQALANSGVEPGQIGYIEAHGTGTSLGDPIEVRALGAVFGKERPLLHPLLIGSIKTNIGHLEAAAGIASVIKTALALQHEEIPPHLHFEQPSPHIPWDTLPVVVPTERQPWPAEAQPRFAGVSAFSLVGTNAHVVLEEAPRPEPVQAALERPLHLLTLSAKSGAALPQLARRYAAHFAAHPTLPLRDACFATHTGRSHFSHRLSVTAATTEEAGTTLAAYATGQPAAQLCQGEHHGADSPKIAFLFTGQGAQYVGMGRQLYATQPTFRQAIDRCDTLLRPDLERPLLSVLYPDEGAPSLLDETVYTQPALFALEYALAELWKSWGVKPDVVMGHSVGEYIAACVAGVFSVEEGLRLIAARGRLMQGLPRHGEMVVVFADARQVRTTIEPYAQAVSIAAINGPQSVVVSGERQAVFDVVERLSAQEVQTTRLTVSHAFHSPLMEPILADFEGVARTLHYAPPQIGLISNVTGALATDEITTPAYWREHIRQPVQFAAGMATLQAQGVEIFVEIGPKPTLLGMGRRCVSDDEGLWLPSLQPGKEWLQLLESLGALYVHGVPINWRGFDQDYPRRPLTLPTYPFQRQRYWSEALPETRDPHEVGAMASDTGAHFLLGYRFKTLAHLPNHYVWENQLDLRHVPHAMQGHRLWDRVVLPVSAYVEIALTASRDALGKECHLLTDLTLHQALFIPEEGSHTVQVSLVIGDNGTTTCRVHSRPGGDSSSQWTLHATAKLSPA